MTINTNALTYLYSVKGTALNKGRARTWIERDLTKWGFDRGTLIDIHFNDAGIVILATPTGSRKVCGKHDKQIIDICYPIDQRTAMFGGAEKLCVHIGQGVITILAEK